MQWKLLIACLVCGLQACGESAPEFHSTDNPLRLSDWNLFAVDSDWITSNGSTLVFQPQNTLFTDHAHKLRTMWIPDSEQIELDNDSFVYPSGTILSKTFYYPLASSGEFLRSPDSGELRQIPLETHRLIETRLLVRRESGWEAFPYVWNEEQSEAFLRVAGTSLPVSLQGESATQEFTYFVPNENQCAGCHTRIHPDGGLEPLGAVAHQLNHGAGAEPGQDTLLTELQDRGWLETIPGLAEIPSWQDESLSLEQRAMAYMDMNCGHCHNPDGPADTSALLLDGFSRSPSEMGSCKPPVAAGGGAGNLLYGIVPGQPESSILLYRMQSTEPDEMMPELGRSLVHEEGLALVRDWISAMPGGCE